MLLLTGAAVSGFLGYKLFGWWAPAAVACATLAAQAVSYQGSFTGGCGWPDFVQILSFTGLMSLFMFYATYSLGRSIGQWKRGVR